MAATKYTLPGVLWEELRKRGVDSAMADIICQELNTDFTAKWMLGYLRSGGSLKPEDLADEMLFILDKRADIIDHMITKHRRKNPVDDFFIRSISINRDDVKPQSYVLQIPALRNFQNFDFKSRITFLTGENGSGKSTLLEALAIACELNAEGGTANYHFHTYDDYSDFSSAIRLKRGVYRPKWRYFLRAESFYNVATALNVDYADGKSQMPDYHARSHGESFLEFIQAAPPAGLYLMDEPEAALSPQRQMALLAHLMETIKEGAQYIIATHSPILLAAPGADILSFDETGVNRVTYEETESYKTYKTFLDNPKRMLKYLLED